MTLAGGNSATAVVSGVGKRTTSPAPAILGDYDELAHNRYSVVRSYNHANGQERYRKGSQTTGRGARG